MATVCVPQTSIRTMGELPGTVRAASAMSAFRRSMLLQFVVAPRNGAHHVQ